MSIHRRMQPAVTIGVVAVLSMIVARPANGEYQSDQAASVFAIQPGMGVGFSAGFNAQAGSSSNGIQNSVGYEGHLSYGTAFGLFVLGGIQISTHEIDQASSGYRLTSFFLEPRFVALKLSSRWAPFVSGRLALIEEAVDEPRAEFTASGYSFGGGVGALYRLTSQLALEAAFNVAAAKLNDFEFRGEWAWYTCLEELSSGASLPESVSRCDGSAGFGEYYCYPPYFERFSGDCTPPAIPYADSGRSTIWYQARLGIQLSFASPY